MQVLSPKNLVIVAAALMIFITPTSAQDGPPEGGRRIGGEGRPNLIRELDLTPEQKQRIQQMNRARRPVMQEAAERLHRATQALDAAIYADTLSEEEVAARLKDVQAAQAEIAKLRFAGELELRKVLTPEQLVKFRTMREQFGRARERRQKMRRNAPPGDLPLRRIRQLPRRGNMI